MFATTEQYEKRKKQRSREERPAKNFPQEQVEPIVIVIVNNP
jgi:hypothetical protein